jgi:ribosomal protein S18 acetylase RimI-like enzyme
MDITVCKLTKNMANDYIDYFDNRAFSDGNIQKGCYCVWHHWTEKHEQERNLMPENERPFRKRDYAKELIERGILNGFVAIHEDKIVGFCNADLKDNYFRLSKENTPNSWIGAREGDKFFSIVCFTVEPDMRRKGIAKAMLDCACRYAKENGYDFVEGYPSQGNFSVSDCGGSVEMYTNQGFDIIEIPNGVVARKKL